MSLAAGFIVGAVLSPFVLLALAYAFAFTGWVVAIIGVFVAIFSGAFLYAAFTPLRPLQGSSAASRTNARPPPPKA